MREGTGTLEADVMTKFVVRTALISLSLLCGLAACNTRAPAAARAAATDAGNTRSPATTPAKAGATAPVAQMPWYEQVPAFTSAELEVRRARRRQGEPEFGFARGFPV